MADGRALSDQPASPASDPGAPRYLREKVHYPEPISPLHASLFFPLVVAAHARATADPTVLDIRVVDGFVYVRFDAARDAARPRHEQDAASLVAMWETTTIPTILADQQATRDAGHDARPRRLLAELDRALARLERHLTWLFEALDADRATMATLTEILASRGVADAESVAVRVANHLPCRLTRIDALMATMGGVGVWPPHDKGDDAGVLWSWVADRPLALDLAAPTWAERPEMFAQAVQAAARQSSRIRPSEMDAATRQILAEVLGEAATPISDATRRIRTQVQDINHLVMEIDVGVLHGLLTRLGAALAQAGILATASDVFWLDGEELRAALDGRSQHEQVTRRRTAAEQRRDDETPDALDGQPVHGPSLGLGVSLGADQPQEPSDSQTDDGPSWRGLGASHGKAIGRVRHVRRLEDIGAIVAGDIVVVTALLPTWTVALSRAAAVVAESGGMLCHAAIVARERAIPAVVGVRGALSALTAGMLVEVDGKEGMVRPSGPAMKRK